MDFDSIEELHNYLNGEPLKQIKQNVKRKVLYIYFRRMKTDVYGAFKPKVYVRRGFSNGGYGDPSNIVSMSTKDGIVMKNIAEANGDDAGENLSYYIENGIYGWKRRPKPRPIFEETMEEIVSTGLVRKSVREVLENMNIEVK